MTQLGAPQLLAPSALRASAIKLALSTMTHTHEPTIHELLDLTGRVALVTGGTGYLGSRFCAALAEAGATVVISSRDAQRAATAAAQLPSPNGAAHYGVTIDHTDAASIAGGFADAVDVAGKVDILVNNGLAAPKSDLTDCTFDEFLQHQANTAGYFELARTLRDHVVSRGSSGNVINIGSMYGQVASYPDAYEGVCMASPVSYHAHKGSVIHMTRHLAAYYARDNVRVNCLSPGPFPNESVPPQLPKNLSMKVPLQRMGKPYELKAALVLLASDAGSYMTGTNITVDGGWTAW